MVLALGNVAQRAGEDLIMEQRTNSPYPRVDRPMLAIIGVLLGILALRTRSIWPGMASNSAPSSRDHP